MIKRTLDIGNPAYVHLRQRQLVVEPDKTTARTFPLEDLGIVIFSHPRIVMTQAAMIACQENNTVLVFCDGKHLPYSAMLPIHEGHTLHSKILEQQIALALPAKKRLWQQIVRHKIDQQAKTLAHFQKDPRPLKLMAPRVRSGDPDNLEAQAAKKYWRLLFGDDFRRNHRKGGVNSLLNYGYAIVRAMVARAVVGGGLHPAIGLHHHNQYNGLNLADDLMEPFRPWVDRVAYQLANQGETEINQNTKKALLGLPARSVCWQGKSMPLMVCCHHLTANLKRAGQDRTVKLDYPNLNDTTQ